MKRVGCILALSAVCLFVGLLVYPVYKVSFIKWPSLEHSDKLIEACELLIAAHSEPTAIPNDEWPSVISNMKPRYVFVDRGYVKITISSGGIGDSWGLIVASSDSDNDVPRYAIQTELDRIYRFK
mgnify:CR=1 FL=1